MCTCIHTCTWNTHTHVHNTESGINMVSDTHEALLFPVLAKSVYLPPGSHCPFRIGCSWVCDTQCIANWDLSCLLPDLDEGKQTCQVGRGHFCWLHFPSTPRLCTVTYVCSCHMYLLQTLRFFFPSSLLRTIESFFLPASSHLLCGRGRCSCPGLLLLEMGLLVPLACL